MRKYADLELSLDISGLPGLYSIDLRFNMSGGDGDILPIRQGATLISFNLKRLEELTHDHEAYGQELSNTLFAEESIRAAFTRALTSTHDQRIGLPHGEHLLLRMRLFIGSGARLLHYLRWETLRNPVDGTLISTGQDILFSRYLGGSEWPATPSQPRDDLRALVVIANPTNLGRYKLPPIDVEGELKRTSAGLGTVSMTALASSGKATLNNMVAHLRDGFDILYVVCHGAWKPKTRDSWLWLENEDGTVALVSGSDLIARLRDLQQRPRLIVLTACQSAKRDGEEAHQHDAMPASLGPRLAQAGISAVVAMQGNISMQTVDEFMPVFFQALQKHDPIDQAMALARSAVRERDDFWMPVLFMNLRSGRIWYAPGFGKEFPKWPTLISKIKKGRCTPIIGFGLDEALIGSSRDIARHWAETYHFPMAPHDQEDLPQVAQFLAINQDESYPPDELISYLSREIFQRYHEHLPPELDSTTSTLDELISAVGKLLRERDPLDPYRLLAQLPVPIYINTNPTSLLEAALIDAGKVPHVALCPWNEKIERTQKLLLEKPTPQRPLVYHLFGHIRDPESLVLTEDDYFDYLIGATTNRDLIPGIVRRALVDTALLFLGFQLDDWNFRVLFRSIMKQEGRERMSQYAHIAVQIDPQESHILDPEGARGYLESYFRNGNMHIFWGSVHDFIRKLQAQLGK
jgi:hypothetical protein